jgi:hypothetical protein
MVNNISATQKRCDKWDFGFVYDVVYVTFLDHIGEVYSPCILKENDTFSLRVENDERASGSASRGSIAFE